MVMMSKPYAHISFDRIDIGGARISAPPSPTYGVGIPRKSPPPLVITQSSSVPSSSSLPPPSYAASISQTGEYVPPAITPAIPSNVGDSKEGQARSQAPINSTVVPTVAAPPSSSAAPAANATPYNNDNNATYVDMAGAPTVGDPSTIMVSMSPPTRYHRLIILRHGSQPIWIPVDQFPPRYALRWTMHMPYVYA
jgi:hypothetical protein